MIKKTIITFATLGLLSITVSAEFDTTGCVGCHGAKFEKIAMSKSKIVKDMTKDEIVTALNGYKDGSYGGSMKRIMKAQALKMSDEEIRSFSEKFGEESNTTKELSEDNITAVAEKFGKEK
jgi:cytochrome c-type protein NapB